ncbi:MAG TPA: hypothetical protein VL123_07095 [Candidatus Udaeobacter sp.]|jgi:hypothetical protein|nr:hypothetical protein [Candidatus Udaeobacter sp.]
MSDPKANERARGEIEKQLVELSGLRNAGSRDSGFKLWRQTTLTLIQRTWPGDDTRSARFRRIPFSPPSTRADTRETREWYERGCGEAAVFLRELIDEVEKRGVGATVAASASSAPAAPEVLPEDGAPLLTLDDSAPKKRPAANGGKSPRAPRVPKRPAPKARLKEMLGFAEDALRPGDATASAGPPPEFQAPPEPMVEEFDLSQHGDPEESVQASPARIQPPRTAEAQPIDEATLQRALEAALHSFVSRESATPPPESELSPADFLNESPVFNAKPRPVRKGAGGGQNTLHTATAMAVAAIASEADSLGVPERHRAITRAALMNLAGHLDRHDLTWQTLRESVHFVMEYPMLARRVLPLLVPFLEEAA